MGDYFICNRGLSSGSGELVYVITINIKCAALCQKGELALDHKDIDETGGL